VESIQRKLHDNFKKTDVFVDQKPVTRRFCHKKRFAVALPANSSDGDEVGFAAKLPLHPQTVTN